MDVVILRLDWLHDVCCSTKEALSVSVEENVWMRFEMVLFLIKEIMPMR